MKIEEKDLKQIIFGDYVLTPIKNAFNYGILCRT